MFGLRGRDTLPTAVLDEFENLVAGLRSFLLVGHDEAGANITPTAAPSFVPIGGEMVWPVATAPPGWLLCQGQAVSRITYRDLFGVLSTTYGVGDGVLTFNVPDIKGRAVYGKAASGTGSTLAGTFGTINHTHTGPSHTHTISGSTATEASHTHDLSDLETSATTTAGTTVLHYTVGPDDFNAAVGGHAHFTTQNTETSDAGSAHSHTAGTLAAAAAGTGATGTNNPPGIAQHYIIYTGVV